MFDDDFLRKLELLRTAFARRAREPREGPRTTSRPGEAVDFAGHRSYAPGDDPRRIDWHAYARLGELFLKQFDRPAAERLSIRIDASASMSAKLDLARKIAAAIYFVGSAGYAKIDVNGRDVTGAPEALDALKAIVADGAARPEFPAGGSVVLLSDFWWDDAAWFDAVRAFRGDLAWVRILSRDEIEPNVHGAVDLVDAETGEAKRLFVTDRELGDYRDAFHVHDEFLRSAALARGIPFASVAAERSIDEVLFHDLRAAGVLA